jgi:hypothetical protein
MNRLAATALLLSITVAQSAFAFAAPSSLEGASPSAVPEPTAALLFAAGIGVSAWALRRRAHRS